MQEAEDSKAPVDQVEILRLERQIDITKKSAETVKQTYAIRQRKAGEEIRKLKAEILWKKEQLNYKQQNEMLL